MKNVNILVYDYGLEQTAILRNWYTSQTNVDNVNVSYVNKTSNHFLLIIGRPAIYTHTQNFKVYAFGCDSIHVILFMRAFDGMLTASPGRQRQRHRASHPCHTTMLPGYRTARSSASIRRPDRHAAGALALCRSRHT